jgi:predicted metal-binding membrane protein
MVTLQPVRRASMVAVVLLASAAAWLGVLAVAGDMGNMPGTMGLGFGSFVAVWSLMMTAMMLTSVVPFTMLYTRTLAPPRGPHVAAFTVGYLLVWSAAALPAYGLAWLADQAVNGRAGLATALAVAIFVAAGIYQLTPFKDRCLSQCRSPLGLVFRYASVDGRTRDLRIGLRLGAYCLGCCWALMALLIGFGVMNVAAMVALAAVVLLEKTVPWADVLSRVVGFAGLALAVAVVWAPGVAPGLEQARHMGGM